MALTEQNIKDSPEVIIVSLAQGGNDAAFSELVLRHQSWVRNLMRRFCNNHILADDLTQQVFLSCWRSLKSLKKAKTFPAWLKRLAVNVWLQHIRKNDSLDGAALYEDSQEARTSDPSLGMDLDRALAQLSPPQRVCVILSYHENMTHPEIVEATGMPIGTVKSHINRGTTNLKKILASYDTHNGGDQK